MTPTRGGCMIRSRLLPALREARTGFLDGWRYGNWHPDQDDEPAPPPPPAPLTPAEALTAAAFAPFLTLIDWWTDPAHNDRQRRP